jgi:hypothetical protein
VRRPERTATLPARLRALARAGHLTARQRALVEPAEGVTAAALEFPGGLPEAAPKPGKRKVRARACARRPVPADALHLQLDSTDAELRKQQAKQRIKAQKEDQLREAREAATAKILSGDTSRKRQAAKAAKEQEVRAQLVVQPACCVRADAWGRDVCAQERLADRRTDAPPKPGFVRIKRGPAGSLVAFAPGEGPYWVAT